MPQTSTHSYTDGRGYYLSCQPAHRERLGVQFLASTWTLSADESGSNLPNAKQLRCLPNHCRPIYNIMPKETYMLGRMTLKALTFDSLSFFLLLFLGCWFWKKRYVVQLVIWQTELWSQVKNTTIHWHLKVIEGQWRQYIQLGFHAPSSWSPNNYNLSNEERDEYASLVMNTVFLLIIK